MFIPSTFKRPVSSWKALNLRKTLLMASSVRLKPRSEERFSRNAETDLVCRLLLEKKNRRHQRFEVSRADGDHPLQRLDKRWLNPVCIHTCRYSFLQHLTRPRP